MTPHDGRRVAHRAAAVFDERERQARAAARRRSRRGDRAPQPVPLDDELRNCLNCLVEAPARYERAAVAWHARWCRAAPALTLAEAMSGLEAVQARASGESEATRAAKALSALSGRHGLPAVAAVLTGWVGAAPNGHARRTACKTSTARGANHE